MGKGFGGEKLVSKTTALDYFNLGLSLIQQSNWLEAIASFKQAIVLKPLYAEAYFKLGAIYKSLKEIKLAVEAYQQAIKIKPDYLDPVYCLGVIFAEQGRLIEATDLFRQAIKLKPDYAEAYNNLGVVLKAQPDVCFAEMETVFKKAIALKSNYSEPCYNLATILTEENRLEEAEKYCRQGIKLNPNYIQAHYNLGFILTEKRLLNQGQQSYQQAIKLKSDYAKAHFSLGLNLLLSGDLKAGFRESEWRWQAYNIYFPKLNQPKWQGENPQDKTILLISEQGLGDTLQFVRYGSVLKNMGAKVKLACQDPLVKLLNNQGIFEEVIPVHETITTEFDVYASLMSLPYLFGTGLESIPWTIPYISSPRGKIPCPEQTKIKVGIVWASGIRDKEPEVYKIYQKKSSSLSEFVRLLAIEGVTLYSLQVGVDAAQIEAYGDNPRIVNLTPSLLDFTDTAAVVEELDLVISVDTAVAHLAGAMGKPVWVLLPFSADWRWLLGRNDTPWYPTMRLFRQPLRGDWGLVFEEVIKALKVL